MRRLLVACLAPALACAGTNPTPGAAPVEQHVVVLSDGATGGSGASSLNFVSSSGVSTREFAAPLERIWKILPDVLDSLAVPVGLLDPAHHTIGNSGFRLRGKLGKVSLSRYIDCGSSQIGPNAESYDITLTLTLALAATPGGATAMTTDLEATARPIAFAQAPFPCTTKGNLEKRVIDLTTALVSR
jgi:hypothetical protein